MGDFNCDMMKNATANKISQLALPYSLKQLIDESINYTENSSYPIDLALVSNPKNIIYSDVIPPFIPGLTKYDCPLILMLKYRKILNHSDK